ncbi:protein NETWORKED 3C [Lactuca sativa]|uniref:NAB domain-containing protein n=1 Tax=Lactuca sativa TaxID=4236 RepID=A0A9R1W373_LACSA|nr:protein NETWORKED 3C [Lactuca sativa]KAJ0216299.1 hypothetical protein LSAT_V11C300122660 [Lactuca sativa]
MENNTNTDNGSSHSWWLDNTHNNRLHQSQWLQSTLSELEKKVKNILSFIEDDGDTFAERAEMFYKKRPLLIKSVEDLQESYKLLAGNYHQLLKRYENLRAFSKLDSPIFANPNRFSPKVLQSCDHNFEDELKKKRYEFFQFADDLENRCDEMRLSVMKLVEDNLELQDVLVKRNDQKREAINELRAHVKKLVGENYELKSKLARMEADVKRNRSQFLRAKDLIFKKILN